MSQTPDAQGIKDHNRRAWDDLVRRGQRFTRPATDQDLRDPLQGADPRHWLGGGVQGKRLLCLAAGGGRQSAIYAAAGALVTVVDLSPEMLELDRKIARDRSLNIQAIEASMDNLGVLAEGSFDIVIHPVSTCYLPEIRPVYREVARVLSVGGLYISQHKTPTSLQADIRPSRQGYELTEPYYRTGPLPAVKGSLHREEGTLEFLHRWQEIIGGMCQAGFVIEDLAEPVHGKADAKPGTWEHRSRYIAPYVRIKARRIAKEPAEPAKIVLP